MNGARVLVIGGTNGIGKAIAEAATQHGARVAVAGASLGLDVRDPVAVESRLPPRPTFWAALITSCAPPACCESVESRTRARMSWPRSSM